MLGFIIPAFQFDDHKGRDIFMERIYEETNDAQVEEYEALSTGLWIY